MVSFFLVSSFFISAMRPIGQDYWFNRVKLDNITLDKPWKINPIVIKVTKKTLPLYRQHWLAEEKRDMLLAPYKILNQNRKLKEQLTKDLLGKVESIKSLSAFYKLVTDKARFPELCFLDECACPTLKRENRFDDLRTSFENKLVNFYDEKVKTQDVSYASLGSGMLFSDLRLILSLLERKKNIKAIHLVDNLYKQGWMKDPLINLKKGVKKETISFTKAFDKSKDRGILDFLIRKLLLGKSDDTRNFFETFYINMAPFFQLITFLTDVMGKEFTLYIHSSVDDYINFCDKNPGLKANFGSIIDYLPENFGALSVEKLIEYLNKQKRDLYNFVAKGITSNGAVGWLYNKNSQKLGKPEEVLKFLLKEKSASK